MITTRSLFLTTATVVGSLLLPLSSYAVISITGAGYFNDFSVAPITGDWITSTSSIAGDESTFTTAAAIDAFMPTYNASTLSSALGSTSTTPPSNSALARWHSINLNLQMRPNGVTGTAGKAAAVMVARMSNGTGAMVSSLDVSYTFGNPVAGTEQIPGWRAFYSVTGNGGWTAIPGFSGATLGNLNANLDFGGAGWAAGAEMFLLWIDDNAAAAGDVNDGTGEAAYTLDNFRVSVVPEPSAVLLLATGVLLLARRRRRSSVA